MTCRRYDAYWISPSGETLPVVFTHIDAIIRNPNTFGLDEDTVRHAFDSYSEPLGFEGKARKEIMLQLLHAGWIRLRYERKRGRWKCELFELAKRSARNLAIWSANVTDEALDGMQPGTEVVVRSLCDGTLSRLTFSQLYCERVKTGLPMRYPFVIPTISWRESNHKESAGLDSRQKIAGMAERSVSGRFKKSRTKPFAV